MSLSVHHFLLSKTNFCNSLKKLTDIANIICETDFRRGGWGGGGGEGGWISKEKSESETILLDFGDLFCPPRYSSPPLPA